MTGVQTCALPIYQAPRGLVDLEILGQEPLEAARAGVALGDRVRSEEADGSMLAQEAARAPEEVGAVVGVPVGVLLSVRLVPEIDVTVVPAGIFVPVTVIPATILPLIFFSVICAVLVAAVTSAYFPTPEPPAASDDTHLLSNPSRVPEIIV